MLPAQHRDQGNVQEMSSLRGLGRPVGVFVGVLLVLQCVPGLEM